MRSQQLLVAAALAGAIGCAPIDRWQVEPRSAPPGGTKDFHLQWDALDPNDLPLNPYWAVQAVDRWRLPPLSDACSPAAPDSAVCTDQPTSRDAPAGLHADICGLLPGPFPGHVNWRPATYTGRVSWKDFADDGDINLIFEPDDPARGMTRGNRFVADDPGRPYIELEFASAEVLFRLKTDWWRALEAAVEEWANAPVDAGRIEALLNRRRPGQPSRAAVVGLFGLDCEQGCKTELHPVFGLAVEVDDRAEHNVWAIFVRNWGTEGYCSSRYHSLELRDDIVRLVLPRTGARAPRLLQESSQYAASSANAPPPVVSYDPSAGIIVTFALPPTAEYAVSELVLHVNWQTVEERVPPADAVWYSDRPSGGTPNIALMVSRAAKVGTRNVRIPLPSTMEIDADSRRAPSHHPVSSGRRGRPADVLEAKRRGDDARMRLLCAGLQSVSSELPPGWRRVCGTADGR